MTTLQTQPKRQYKKSADLRELWIEFNATKSQLLRNKLIERYLHLVKFHAERLHLKLPSEIQIDDLISSGMFGLFDAINAFDINRGIKFETYCAPRIRGAILDELRAMDWVPRLTRTRSNKVGNATKQLEVELGRQPSHAELAKYLKVSSHEFNKIKADSMPVGLTSLSRKRFETDSNKDVCEIDVLEDRNGNQPFDNAIRQDFFGLVQRGLDRAERLIILLYYKEEMTMKEIGYTLDLSESRVSQIHTSILMRLKARLNEDAV